jgi:hypothetical protein
MRRNVARLIGLTLLTVIFAVPAAYAGPRIFVQIGPPAPVVVAPIPRPVPYGYVWQPGYYMWRGPAYQWVPGVWARPPYARAVWESPRWVYERRGWYAVPGRWRRR